MLSARNDRGSRFVHVGGLVSVVDQERRRNDVTVVLVVRKRIVLGSCSTPGILFIGLVVHR